ncbi:MAG: ureidoglycolate lyase [Hyphomicrobiales bacterium]
MIKLLPEKLTQQSFAEFGNVIEMDAEKSFLINDDYTRRYHNLASVDVADGNGHAIFSIFKSKRRPFPLEIKMMENHPLGSQAFMPMQPHDWLIVVATGKVPTAETCRAFIATGNQGVQYAKGVWHHPLLTLVAEQDFWIVDRAGDGNNLVEHFFDETIAVVDIESKN